MKALGILFCNDGPDWDITSPEMKTAWESGEENHFYPCGKSYAKIFGEQE